MISPPFLSSNNVPLAPSTPTSPAVYLIGAVPSVQKEGGGGGVIRMLSQEAAAVRTVKSLDDQPPFSVLKQCPLSPLHSHQSCSVSYRRCAFCSERGGGGGGGGGIRMLSQEAAAVITVKSLDDQQAGRLIDFLSMN